LSSINDNIKLATGGNSVADALSSWYSRTGNESLDDAESRWLSGIDTQGGGSNSDIWFNILRSAGYVGSLADMKAAYWASPITFPSELSNLEMWARFNSGITVTGLGVSQWDDVSGNSKHFLQAVDSKRPSHESNGAVLCDGVDEFLFATSITLTQPHTTYILVNTKTWTSGDVILGFGGGANRYLQQTGTTPDLYLNNQAAIGPVSPVLDTYNVIALVSNGASSVIQLNSDTPVTGNTGVFDGTSITIGTNNQATSFGHAEYKETVTFSVAHDATTRAGIIAYLSNVGGL